jgi:hypothetical protein
VIRSSVYILISEQMPVNGTYPASGIESVHETIHQAWCALDDIATAYDVFIQSYETVFYVPDEKLDLERYEYIEYRIEEHEVKGEPNG